MRSASGVLNITGRVISGIRDRAARDRPTACEGRPALLSTHRLQ